MQISDILKGVKVGDLAGADEANVITVSPDTPARDAARLQMENTIGIVVVVDDNGGVAGVLSERDIVHAIADHGEEVLAMTAESLMTKDVQTCSLDDPPHEVIGRMSAGNFRHMPVEEDDSPCNCSYHQEPLVRIALLHRHVYTLRNVKPSAKSGFRIRKRRTSELFSEHSFGPPE